MRKLHIIRHINRMNRSSFSLLSLGLFIFSLSLCAIAVELCHDYRCGAQGLIYKYPIMLERITLPFVFLLGVSLIMDINEKRNGS